MDAQILICERKCSYLPIKYINQHLPFNIRRRLVTCVKSLRKVNRTFPIHFKNVRISADGNTYTVKLNDLKWTFTKGEGPSGVIVSPEGVTHSSDDVLDRMHRLIRYYIARRECTVERFDVEKFAFTQPLQSISKIGQLSLDLQKTPIGEHCLDLFRSAQIGAMAIAVCTDSTEWIREIRNFNCTHVVIEPSPSILDVVCDLEVLCDLPFKELKIYERKYQVPDDRFIGMCEKLKSGKHGRGSCWSIQCGYIHGVPWGTLKERYETKVLHRNIIVVDVDVPGCELLVQQRKTSLCMRIVKEGTARCAARREHLACTMTFEQLITLITLFHTHKPILLLILLFCVSVVYSLTVIQQYLELIPTFFQVFITTFLVLFHWCQVMTFVAYFPLLRSFWNYINEKVEKFEKRKRENQAMFISFVLVLNFVPVIILPILLATVSFVTAFFSNF